MYADLRAVVQCLDVTDIERPVDFRIPHYEPIAAVLPVENRTVSNLQTSQHEDGRHCRREKRIDS
jgi:hypothetical protein